MAHERIPPQDLEAERAVLGGILRDNDASPAFAPVAEPR
ncbi:MAG TPA: DnaB-like helicase N-terminal domain-containing protein [Thermodesulfobacteriota bacterium]